MSIKVLSAIVLVPLAVAGCTKSSMSPDSKEEAKEYTVSLACGGEIKDVSISDLTKADGVVVPIATKTFDFYRNKLTTITVKVSNRSEDSGVGVEIEDSQMTDGDNYTVETE